MGSMLRSEPNGAERERRQQPEESSNAWEAGLVESEDDGKAGACLLVVSRYYSLLQLHEKLAATCWAQWCSLMGVAQVDKLSV